MSPINSLPSERVAIVGNIDPDAYAAGTYTTGWIALKDYKRFMAVVQAGDLGSSATLDAKLTAATSSGGAGSADITSSSITQLTQAGSDSNKQVVINLDTCGAFLAGSAYTHFRLSMTVGTATSDAGGIVFGLDPVSAPASDSDASTVDEIVSV